MLEADLDEYHGAYLTEYASVDWKDPPSLVTVVNQHSRHVFFLFSLYYGRIYFLSLFFFSKSRDSSPDHST